MSNLFKGAALFIGGAIAGAATMLLRKIKMPKNSKNDFQILQFRFLTCVCKKFFVLLRPILKIKI